MARPLLLPLVSVLAALAVAFVNVANLLGGRWLGVPRLVRCSGQDETVG